MKFMNEIHKQSFIDSQPKQLHKMTKILDNFQPGADLLKDKIILVTGATGSFGRVVSMAYAKHGATVILLAKNLRSVEVLYDKIEIQGYPTPAIYPMNLEGATEHDYAELANNIEKEFGRLDGLVHCAGILGAPTPFEYSDTETWIKVHQVNLHAPYLLTRSVIPLLRQSEKASVVFMTDDKVGAYWDAYSASKQALATMALNIAAEYEGSNIHINCFNPGRTKTAFQIRAFPAADGNEGLPTPEDHSKTFLYLVSDELQDNGTCYVSLPAP
jgi:NAD(P)-dependent dehydrogenase (short-subunit alcohol dehydrogenase family)